MTAPGIGDTVELDGLRAGNGGVMVGRHDGRVVFVRGALPDERVVARITDDRRSSYLSATVEEILESSDHRVPDRCAAATAGAGCCDLSHADDAGARAVKNQVIADLLGRIGGFDESVSSTVEMRTLTPTSAYRTRVRMPAAADGAAGNHVRSGDGVVTGARCAQPVPEILDAVGGRAWTPGAEVVAVRGDDGVVHLAERAPDTRTPRHSRSTRSRAQRSRARQSRTSVTPVEGGGVVHRRVGGRQWSVPVTGFWQAHVDGAAGYSALVAEMAAAHAPDARTAWDLYGGVGVFAGTLCDVLPSLEHVTVVESDAEAVAAARVTFADDHRVAAYRGPVAGAVRALPSPDVVVADPPRSGLGAEIVDAIAAARPSVIVHVGCDPAAAARDLGLFSRRGYVPARIVAVDAFGLTHHVEVVAALVSVD
ncbi:class I SAM-dependent RNA methyltransferase [Williamsia deligens]|uniref:Class I SAM-dependent RNA methyltransferase n=1 Tax=Williamsia deligens TaxID=321325 RepID=A0ABW3GBY2_9NOCA|nr:TRAM domain-containing protein [Williamsia deligens]MCP2195386.1 tRNA/tmRNA/rRNA uracil-C5-methylase, TrmA/RlmC/RlmD family [Williamsia deligens]